MSLSAISVVGVGDVSVGVDVTLDTDGVEAISLLCSLIHPDSKMIIDIDKINFILVV